MISLPDPASLALFTGAALLLLLTPGPAVLYIVTRSLDQGRRAGLVSVLGVHVGTLVHVVAATAGLSMLLATSALLWTAVKYLGAAYLVFLGVRRLLDTSMPAESAGSRAVSHRRAFVDGAVVNVLNPKTGLFFLAFLPQFVDPARGPVGGQLFALGVLFVGLGLMTDGLYAMAAGAAGSWLRGRASIVRAIGRASGGIYIGLGVLTALSGSHRK